MLNDVDPQTCTHSRLRQFTRLVTSHDDHLLRATGISNAQLALLSHVFALGPVQPGILARRMQMDASTLTRNVQLPVAKGWLVMAKGSDARSRLIHITEAGRMKRAQGQQLWRQAQLALSAKLGSQHLADLHALLDNCIQRLQGTDRTAAADCTGWPGSQRS